jgi:DNA-binding NtrC family response regulator
MDAFVDRPANGVHWVVSHVLDCERPSGSRPTLHSLSGVSRVTLQSGARADAGSVKSPAGDLLVRLPGGACRELDLFGTDASGWRLSRALATTDASVLQASVRGCDWLAWAGHVFSFRQDPVRGCLSSEALPLQTSDWELRSQLNTLLTVSRSMVPVLITGESGTGKEIVARSVHTQSGRRGRFVAINCGALPESLVQGQLFGHRRGSFSGAVDDQVGFIRDADGGTLFLDEIGELPLLAQASLLRVLQESEVTPIGSSRPVKVDVRVVAATNRCLDELTKSGQFRSDLLGRLLGFSIELPPLRSRAEDLGLLIPEFLRRTCSRPEELRLSSDAALALLTYEWPLNVRELERCLSTAVVLAGGGRIGIEHLSRAVRGHWAAVASAGSRRLVGVNEDVGGEAQVRPLVLSEEQKQHREVLIGLLLAHRGNVAAIASSLGKARMQLHRWFRRYSLDPARFRAIGRRRQREVDAT